MVQHAQPCVDLNSLTCAIHGPELDVWVCAAALKSPFVDGHRIRSLTVPISAILLVVQFTVQSCAIAYTVLLKEVNPRTLSTYYYLS